MRTNPFPGVDPYLEGSPFWQGFHNGFMHYVLEAVQPLLPAHYVATLELRIYFERDETGTATPERVPDLELVKATRTAVPLAQEDAGLRLRGEWVSAPTLEQREAYVEIRHVADQQPVTSVELLSPTNKRRGAGRREYQEKQEATLDSRLNLVEVDLLRGGIHTVAAPQDSLYAFHPYDHVISVFRSARPWGFEVLHWTLREPLPVIPIPLSAGDQELDLDLAEIYERTYRTGAFNKLLRYQAPPRPSFRQEDDRWADALLRAAELRGGYDA